MNIDQEHNYNKENVTRAWLMHNHKIYPICDGHNILGRNPDAHVCFRSPNISKQQSIITVVEPDQHYVSDLNSVNGTTLNSKKLRPFQLYKLDNGASLKFGDVFCTYKKISKEQNVSLNFEPTQRFSETFFNACTQEIQPASALEGVNFNEMPTQMFIKEPSLNELPTQIFQYECEDKESSNESIDFATMKAASETQNLNKANSEDLLIEVKVSSLQKVVSNVNSESNEDELSPIKPVGVSARKIIASDSDTEEYDATTVKNKSKYIISDDSETDIEDETDENKELEKSEVKIGDNLTESVDLNRSNNLQGDESTVEEQTAIRIPDCLHSQIDSESQTQNLNTQVISDSNIELKQTEQEENEDIDIVPDLQVHNEERNQEGGKEGTSLSENINEDTVEALELEAKPPTSNVSEDTLDLMETGNNEEPPKEETNMKKESIDDNTEEIFAQATQQLNLAQYTHEPKNQNAEIGNKTEDVFEIATQQLTFSDKRLEENNDRTSKENDVFLLPTQSLEITEDAKPLLLANLKILPSTSTKEEEAIDELENQKDIFKTPTLRKSSQKIQVTNTPEENEDFLPSTQNLQMICGSPSTTDALPQAIEDLHEVLAEGNEQSPVGHILKSPTFDKANTFLSSEDESSEKTPTKTPNAVVFKTPSLKKPKSLQKSFDEEEDLLQPTQALEVMHEPEAHYHKIEDNMHEIFASQSMLCTQQLVSVLETSKSEDVIEDSMFLDSSVKNISVQDILEDVRKDEEDNGASKEGGMSKRQTKNKKNERISKDRKDEDQCLEKAKSEEAGTSVRSTRSKNKDKSNCKQEDVKEEQSENKTTNNTKAKTKKMGTTSRSKSKEENHEDITNPGTSGAQPEIKEKRNTRVSKSRLDVNTKNEDQSETIKENQKVTEVFEAKTSGRSMRNKQTITTKEDKNTEKPAKETRRSRRGDLAAAVPETNDESKIMNESNSNEKTLKVDEEVSRQAEHGRTRASTSRNENNRNKTLKRKNEETEKTVRGSRKIKTEVEVEKTPAKKKSDEEIPSTSRSTRKRGLQSSNYDSEDDFVSNVPEPTPKDEKGETSITNVTPAKRGRRLSANSRQEMNEENKSKKKKGEDALDQSRKGKTSTPSRASISSESGIERNRRITKPKVVFTMMDSPELESLIRQLGGSVVDSVNSCTVLVTKEVKRTLKLLVAVAQGKPICSPKWLEACKKAFAFVDPWDYILIDGEAETRWNFSLKNSLVAASEAKLLENYTFQLMVNSGADVLKGAIEACGGKCVTRNLAKTESDHLMIVSTKANKAKYSKVAQQNSRIKVVEAEAVFDGTLRQEFRFESHLLL